MPFRDQKLICRVCGRTFFFTVTEQRQMAERLGSEAFVPPEQCPACQSKQTATGDNPQSAVIQGATLTPGKSRAAATRKPAPGRGKSRAVAMPEPLQETRTDLAELEVFPLEVEGVKIKLIGRVKWYSREKGYGFVTAANNQDIFFHRASLQDRYARLREGDQVEFQIEQTAKGPEAINVSLLPED